ncbi:MAG TPA: Holliday junction branch migration protein RuvA [Candidatus Babeliales bacterium]|nr:Holliday junction branch migration protein RuvA [Candidatus Babeliales bacterium]
MFSQLSGTILAIHDLSITLSVHGIGFELFVPDPTVYILEQPSTVFTHLHWHQENGPTLFGFHTELEKRVFVLILSCSGVGPKIGLSVLRDLGASEFLHILMARDSKSLSKVNGIGAKKSEQIILHLQDKAAKLVTLASANSMSDIKPTLHIKEVGDALSSLGYSRQEIVQAMQYVHDHASEHEYVFDKMFRKALSFLTR